MHGGVLCRKSDSTTLGTIRGRERERFPAPISIGSGAAGRTRSGARASMGVISSKHKDGHKHLPCDS